MKKFTQAIRFIALLSVLVSTLFASAALADNVITASGIRYTDNKGNDLKTISIEFKNIPAEYEGWQALVFQTTPVCGVVTDGVVNCEFRHENKVNGIWLYLTKAPDQTEYFYVNVYIPGMKLPKPVFEECEPMFTFGISRVNSIVPNCGPF